MNNLKTANRVSVITMIVNIILSVFKLIAGIISHSAALVSDAVHSASDVVSTIAVIAGINIAARESDKGHQYGHDRMENLFSLILAIILFMTGAGIGFSGIKTIAGGNYEALPIPGMLALIAAIASIVIKEWMYHYTIQTARKINSSALKADAWHHRSDALSSIGSLVGVLGARMGFPICDSIAGVVICLFIIKASWDIFMESVDGLVDHAASDEDCSRLREIILAQEGVIGIDDLKTRLFGSKMYVDVEIGADGQWTLQRAHEVAQQVHDAIEEEFPMVKHCMVHVNPKNT